MQSTRVRRSSSQFMLGTIVNVAIGFLFQLVLARQLGLSGTADAWAIGTSVPAVCAMLLIGSVPSRLMPFVTGLADRGLKMSWRTALGQMPPAIRLLLASGAACSVTSVCLGRHQESALFLVIFLVSMLMAMPFAWAIAVVHAVLVHEGRFLVVGLSGAFNGLGLLSVAVLSFQFSWGLGGLGIAYLSGYCCELLVIALLARKAFTFRERSPFPPTVGTQLYRMLGVGLVFACQPIVERTIALGIPGGPAALNFSIKIGQAALLASTLGLGMISLPRINRAIAEDGADAGTRVATKFTLYIAGIAAPVIALGIVEREFLVNTLLAGGRFGAGDVKTVSGILALSLIGVYFSAMCAPLSHLYNLTDRSGSLLRYAVTTLVVGSVTAAGLRPFIGVQGIAAGMSLMTACYFLRLIVGASPRPIGDIFTFATPLLLACSVAAAISGIAGRAGTPDLIRGAAAFSGAAACSLLYIKVRRRLSDDVPVGPDRVPAVASARDLDHA